MSCDENPALLLFLGINLKKHTPIKKMTSQISL